MNQRLGRGKCKTPGPSQATSAHAAKRLGSVSRARHWTRIMPGILLFCGSSVATRRIWDELQARIRKISKRREEATTEYSSGSRGFWLRWGVFEIADRLAEASEDMRLRCVERKERDRDRLVYIERMRSGECLGRGAKRANHFSCLGAGKGKCGKELNGNVKLDQSSSGSQLYPVDLDIGITATGSGLIRRLLDGISYHGIEGDRKRETLSADPPGHSVPGDRPTDRRIRIFLVDPIALRHRLTFSPWTY